MNISLSGLENDFQKIGHDLTDREAIEEVKQYLYYYDSRAISSILDDVYGICFK
jgi:hypothetical protein